VRTLRIESLDDLLEVLKVLANPTRLKIVALLARRPMYVSEIARELKVPYPLVHLYLSKLEQVGIVRSRYEFVRSERPHVRRYCELADFRIVVSPEAIRRLAGGEEREG